MKKYIKQRKGFFTIIGILLALIIALFLCYKGFNAYYGKTGIKESTKQSLSEQGIDTTSHQSVLESVRMKTKDIERQIVDREKQILEQGRQN